MEMPIAMEATGYSWECNKCGHSNYHIYTTPEIECVMCGTKYKALYKHKDVQENIETKYQGETDKKEDLLILKPSGYEYKCPECYHSNTVNSACRIVKCKKCKAELTVGRWYHRKAIEAT